MGFSQKLFLLLIILLVIPATTYAETAYVSDQLVITLRRGKSAEHKILNTLKTGTPVEILEKQEGEKYVKVRTGTGVEGYVLGQYLTEETPKPMIISHLEKENEKLKKRLAQAKAGRAETSREIEKIKKQHSLKEVELKKKIEELNRLLVKSGEGLQTARLKYDTLLENSNKVVEITNERDRLQESNKELVRTVQTLATENSELKRNGVVRWFLAGAGVLFLGWLIGKASGKKQRGLY